jgi:hypothetical protein
MFHRLTIAAVAAAVLSVTTGEAVAQAPATTSASCVLSAQDGDWTRQALEGWGRVNESRLQIAPVTLPTLVLFDQACTHVFRPAADSVAPGTFRAAGHAFEVASSSHSGQIAIPGGDAFPVGLTSFAAPGAEGRMFFVMSLPSLWRAKAVASNTDMLATVVFVHEFTHTQSASLGARVDALIARGLPAEADDDVIQTRFGDRPGFKAAYEAERDLLFRAATASNLEDSRKDAAAALRSIERRRRTYFAGADAIFAEAEAIFLTMEGIAQWAAYAWLIDPSGGSMAPAEALPFLRRGGKRWSQDEGLALLLVLDRLSPGWPAKLLAPEPINAIELAEGMVSGKR